MFKVRFKTLIHGTFACASSSDVYVERVLMLPFVPHVGLEVSHGDWWVTVESVHYKADVEEFVAYGKDDKEIYQAVLDNEPHRSIEEIVKDYTDCGWVVKG